MSKLEYRLPVRAYGDGYQPGNSQRRSRRPIVHLIAAALALLAQQAGAICVGTAEEGRWWNEAPGGDPTALQISMDECGDTVLNGVPTRTSYGLKVFVQQSSGKLYQRPKVAARYRRAGDGTLWLFAAVATGGYQDQMWMRRKDINGTERLYVYIRHQSLDSKPSAESKHWFFRNKPVPRLQHRPGEIGRANRHVIVDR